MKQLNPYKVTNENHSINFLTLSLLYLYVKQSYRLKLVKQNDNDNADWLLWQYIYKNGVQKNDIKMFLAASDASLMFWMYSKIEKPLSVITITYMSYKAWVVLF